ncbi:hypothetical protein GCM10009001_09140 [Virgibacillus siamensis]|uniref:Uncharacterized protein n=1 Tax=Virgibacillus siamensis TaxID=480071 RepID=A0ABN1FPL4_9BACI
MNWPVVKDLKWLVFQSTSILSAVVGIILAVSSNHYWVLFVCISMFLMYLGASRATKLTR